MSDGLLDDELDIAEALDAWASVLDELSYYAVLGVEEDADADGLKEAFARFALSFHPDAHATRPGAELTAAGRIFARGAEAYEVLSDGALRAQYDAALAEGALRLARSGANRPDPKATEGETRPPLDTITNAAARPFARKAEELAQAESFKQARLHLDLALFHDPDNRHLRAYREWLSHELRKRGP